MHLGARLGAVAVSLGMVVALSAAPASAADTIGSPGIGDSYFPLDGNGGYDVRHYDLRLRYNPPTDELSGTTTILATATQDLTQFNLDFLLHPSAVLVNNAPAEFTSEANGELVVRPASRVAEGSRLLIVVKYRDTPGKYTRYGKQMWRPNGNGVLIAGEPHIATWWFPSNDHPTDKATYDVSMAVPPGLEFITGGLFLRTQPLPGGWTRWNWRSAHQRNTYVSSGVIGDFDVYHQTAPNGQQFITAYEKSAVNRTAAEASFERAPELIDYLASKFGPYPFEAQGGVLTARAGGLEVQGRPFVGDIYFSGGSAVQTVLHELAHEWFGNSVSLRRWQDAWLNEGFATYAEYLWLEDSGENTAAELARQRYDLYPADNGIWTVPVAEPPLYGTAHPAGAAIYHRGAMVLQNLRVTVGDDTFLEILRGWVADKKYGDGSTAEFVAHAERVAGRSLDGVFDTWLYSVGKPATGPSVVVQPSA